MIFMLMAWMRGLLPEGLTFHARGWRRLAINSMKHISLLVMTSNVARCTFIALIVLNCQLYAQKINIQPPNSFDFDSAVRFLSNCMPLVFRETDVQLQSIMVQSKNDAEKYGKILRSYNDTKDLTFGQSDDPRNHAISIWKANVLAAIKMIQVSHREVDVDTILPYLDIIDPANDPGIVFVGRYPNTLEGTRAAWPALATIMDMPNAAKDLETFTLDKSKYLDLRMDALHVLKFVDKQRFGVVSNQLKNEFSGSLPENSKKVVIEAINAWQNADASFTGVFRIPSNGW